MPQNPDNVINPDLVDVADQGDGPLSVDQAVLTGPTQVAGTTVAGGAYSPQSPDTEDVTLNNVRNQVYGSATPAEIYV